MAIRRHFLMALEAEATPSSASRADGPFPCQMSFRLSLQLARRKAMTWAMRSPRRGSPGPPAGTSGTETPPAKVRDSPRFPAP